MSSDALVTVGPDAESQAGEPPASEPLRNRRQEETFRKVLAAGIETLREKSYADLTVRAVAAREDGKSRIYAYEQRETAALSDAEVRYLYQVEAPHDVPLLDIVVTSPTSVRVSLFVATGSTYQMESSTDLSVWTPEGSAFLARQVSNVRDFNVAGGAKFFRLTKLP